MTLVISKGLTLDNGTRAAAIAGVSPTLDYRFAREKREIETVSLTDKLTYTGGNGTFVGSDGFIQRATTNVPRFDHDPLSRQSLGLLVEGSRENLLLRSEEFNNAYLTNTAINVTANSGLSPGGNISADLLIADTSSALHGLRSDLTVATNINYTLSVFAKQGVGSYGIALAFGSAAAAGGWNSSSRGHARFNLNTQTLVTTATAGNASIISTSITPASDGWHRYALTFTPDTTGTNAVVGPGFVALPTTQSPAAAWTGDGSSGAFFWGAQLEAASTPSTYIPTTSAAVTRTADSAVIDGTGVLTGTYTMVEKPAGCAVVSGTNINLQPGFHTERVMVFPTALDAGQITAIRGAM
jgi:hypothetical protein